MNWPLKLGLSLHLHVLLGRVNNLATADNRCYQFGPRSGLSEKVNFEKKNTSRRKKPPWNYTEGKGLHMLSRFDAQAISAIWRWAVKCSGEMANLLRITMVLFGHSCNKYLILMRRCVTDVYHVRTQMRLTIRAFSQALSGPDFAIPKVIKK